MSLFGLLSNPFDELVDRATSENFPVGTEDIALNLEIADKIKGKEVPAKTAIAALKRRINHKNPNVQLLALKLTDTCVKNSGHHFLQEVASREFVDNLISLARSLTGTNTEVKQKAFALIQTWGIAFKSKLDLGYMCEMYEVLKRDGAPFPPVDRVASAAAIIDTQTAPEWTDSDICMRCRTAFTTFNRKHHCRNCGQTFCNDCSSKRLPLPHLGVTDAVRVCDTCHFKITTKSVASTATRDAPARSSTSSSRSTPPLAQAPSLRDDLVRKEEDDLAKAIAASLAISSGSGAAAPRASSSATTARKPSPKQSVRFEDSDEDLRRAIEESLKESNTKASASLDRHSSGANRQSSLYGEVPAYSSSSAPQSRVPASEAAVPANEVSSKELEHIRLFVEVVERTEADVAVRGVGAINPAQLQSMIAQIEPLRNKLYASIERHAHTYKTMYEINEQISDAVKLYDALLQQRLVLSQQKAAGVPYGYAGVQPAAPTAAAPVPAAAYYGAPPGQYPVGYAAPAPAQAPAAAYAAYDPSAVAAQQPPQMAPQPDASAAQAVPYMYPAGAAPVAPQQQPPQPQPQQPSQPQQAQPAYAYAPAQQHPQQQHPQQQAVYAPQMPGAYVPAQYVPQQQQQQQQQMPMQGQVMPQQPAPQPQEAPLIEL
nr:Vacuolar protein-sorting-associated protein 27 [Polyrhizophydium stewartii]